MIDEAIAADRLFGTSPAPAAPAQRSADDIAAERLYGAPPAPVRTAKVSDPAATMYGGPDTPPVPDDPHRPHTEKEMQAILYPEPEKPAPLAELPPEVQELRDLPDRRMFDAQGLLREAVPEPTDEQCQALGIDDPAAARKGVQELREMFLDLDVGALDVRTLRTRAETLRDKPVETITQRESAVEALNREFGSGAYRAWLDAQALVARDPRVGKMIETMGLGDDAETIVMLAKKARSQRAAGKLKARI